MKKLLSALLPGILLIPVLQQTALAHKKYAKASTYSQNRYVEKFHSGMRENPGYVSSSEERVKHPCPKNMHFHGKKSYQHQQGALTHEQHAHPSKTSDIRKLISDPVAKDNNSCLEGTLAGGVLGAALGGVLAKKDNWIWSIPAGAVGGALVGCLVDGG